jgi:hypothetical protein
LTRGRALASGAPSAAAQFSADDTNALVRAAETSSPEVVRLMLAHGAQSAARDSTYRATPRERAIHGSTHCRDAAAEYEAILRILE